MGRAHEVRAASMAKTAAMKSKKYAYWGKEIFKAAKSGVPDPNMNQTLKKVIEKAKKDQCTAAVIDRAILKAKGALSGAAKEKIYEGYGPGKVAVIVECLTDNDNRTISDVQTCFKKTGGELGNTVSYLFNRKGIFKTEELTEDECLEILLNNDLDYEDITVEDGLLTLTSEPQDFDKIYKILVENTEVNFLQSEVTQVPTTYTELDEEHEEKFRRMIDMLRELDDVSEIYHNANIEV